MRSFVVLMVGLVLSGCAGPPVTSTSSEPAPPNVKSINFKIVWGTRVAFNGQPNGGPVTIQDARLVTVEARWTCSTPT